MVGKRIAFKKSMMLKTIKNTDKTLKQNDGGTKMETTLINDYYLQFDKKYFISREKTNKDVTNNNDMTVSNTKIRLLGHNLFNGILRTVGEILFVFLLLALCKYAGMYELWIKVVEKLV